MTDVHGAKAVWSGPDLAVIDQYRITARAWIPQSEVADPQNPLDRTPVTTQRYCTPPRVRLSYLTSRFDGNNHTGYNAPGAAYPVKGEVSVLLNWDGASLTPVGGVQTRVGPTFRRVSYTDLRGAVTTCTQAVQAPITAGPPAVSGSTFQISFATSNPLTPAGLTPAINAKLSGTFQGGTLAVTDQTDTFPSHGFEVQQNAAVLSQQVVFNAACLNVLGPVGIGRITIGLLAFDGTAADRYPDDRSTSPAPGRTSPPPACASDTPYCQVRRCRGSVKERLCAHEVVGSVCLVRVTGAGLRSSLLVRS